MLCAKQIIALSEKQRINVSINFITLYPFLTTPVHFLVNALSNIFNKNHIPLRNSIRNKQEIEN